LRDAGVFAVGISLDATEEEDTTAPRAPGRLPDGASGGAGRPRQRLYPYVVTVVTRDLLPRERFLPLLRFAGDAGALEVHVLEPSASGKLTGQTACCSPRQSVGSSSPTRGKSRTTTACRFFSSFSYLESPEAFGCGAGLTHIYIDGGGEVLPCNSCRCRSATSRASRSAEFGPDGLSLLPAADRLRGAATRAEFSGRRPAGGAGEFQEICAHHLPREHALPAFFRIRNETQNAEVGAPELQDAYNRVHADYDTFWLAEAARPVDELIAQIPWNGHERVFEAGCGTGYATALLAERSAHVQAAIFQRA